VVAFVKQPLTVTFLVTCFATAACCGESVQQEDGANADAGSPSGGDGSGGTGGAGATGEAGVETGGVSGAGAASAGFGATGDGGTVAGAGAGNGGTVGGAGAGNGGSVAGAGSGSGGTGGGPIPDTLPTCITDLYAACWPEGACYDDADLGMRCWDSGVRVVAEPVAGSCFESATTTYYKPDGSVCFSLYDAMLMGQACETRFVHWRDANNQIVADQSAAGMQPPKLYPTCSNAPTAPCTGARCDWPTSTCSPGECPPLTD
jgi:hypothetical protein